jgi:multidrug efflux pump subunit AcrA (membrane-fusion protein)
VAADIRAAEVALSLARSTLERAEADQVRMSATPSPPSELEFRTAEQGIAAARLALQRAITDRDRLGAGPDPNAVRAAERDLATAEAAVVRAQADLDRVNQGPDPLDVRAAERDVERARNNLFLAMANVGTTWGTSPIDPNATNQFQTAPSPRDSAGVRDAIATREAAARDAAVARDAAAQREAAINSARGALEAAEDRLAKLRQPPSPNVVEPARRALEDARSAQVAAKERLDAARNVRPDPLALAAADGDVSRARLALEQAEAQLDRLKAPPPAPDLSQQAATVESARVAVVNAETQLESLRARTEQTPQTASNEDIKAYDRMLMLRGIEQERAALSALEQELAATTLRAPFSGVVGSLMTQPGGRVEAGRPVVTLTNLGDPVLEASLLPADTSRISAGQQVQVQPDGSNERLSGAVLGVSRSTSGTGSVVRIRVSWGINRPSLGAGARAEITLQEKADALLVPRRAIRSASGRNYVEYLEGDTREIVEVTLGMIATNDAEVLGGLEEGQTIWVGP